MSFSLGVSLFLELECFAEGIAMPIAQYGSYGSLVVFLMWGTELYASIASPCQTVSRMAGFVFDEWGWGVRSGPGSGCIRISMPC